jgi:predicted RNA binding protein YcfA (HicA-like mRNA interferase family)
MTAKEVMDILRKNGWYLDRINGSHHVFEKDGASRSVSVPVHGNHDIGHFAKRILKEARIK